MEADLFAPPLPSVPLEDGEIGASWLSEASFLLPVLLLPISPVPFRILGFVSCGLSTKVCYFFLVSLWM